MDFLGPGRPDLINLDHADPGIRQGQEQQLLTFWEVVRDSQWVTFWASSKKGPAIFWGHFRILEIIPNSWMVQNGKAIYKWMIWGYPYFGKPPLIGSQSFEPNPIHRPEI